MPKVTIVFHHVLAHPPPALWIALDEAVNAGVEIQCAIFADPSALPALASSQKSRSIASTFLHFPVSPADFWLAKVNCGLAEHKNVLGGYLLFLSSATLMEGSTLPALIETMEQGEDIPGVYPLLVEEESGERISHLGYVADCRHGLHSLHEGMKSERLPDALKEYEFQLANDVCLLFRTEDFFKLDGFKVELEELAFFDFSIRLKDIYARNFICKRDLKASFSNRFDSWQKCGLWTSLINRGKIDPGILEIDYPKIAVQEGFAYGASQWLHEFALTEFDIPANGYGAWLKWRHDPNPFTLLAFVGTLAGADLTRALCLCRDLPASLPVCFDTYEIRLHELLETAEKSNLEHLLEDLNLWEKKARAFRYGKLQKGMNLLRQAGVYDASLDAVAPIYDAWLELAASSSFERIEPGQEWPEISVCMPVWNPDPGFFIQAVNSIRSQSYPRWRLCLADDASTLASTSQLLARFSSEDSRITFQRRSTNGHISAATNTALAMTDSPWAAFMDQDDTLDIHALAEVARAIVKNGSAAFIFTDEDHIDEKNERRNPHFKPDFGYLQNFGHLSVCKKELIRRLGGLRSAYDGSQDFDFSMRAAESLSPDRIMHIPKILYHWRVHEGSAAGAITAKPYVMESAKKALEATLARGGFKGMAIKTGGYNFYKLKIIPHKKFSCGLLLPDDQGRISLAMQNAIERLAECLDLEIYLPALKRFRKCDKRNNLRDLILHAPVKTHSLPALCNEAARRCDSDALLVLSDTLEPLPECEPEQLVYLLMLAKAAAVCGLIWQGAQLWNGGYYPNADGSPFPLLKGALRPLLRGYVWGKFLLTRQVLGAPLECVCFNADLLRNCPLDEKLGAWSALDFSLRQERDGHRSLASPWGQFSLVRPWTDLGEEGKEKFLRTWKSRIARHGLRNVNLKAAPDNAWTLILDVKK